MAVFRKLFIDRNGRGRVGVGGDEVEEGGWLEELGEEGRLSPRRDLSGV